MIKFLLFIPILIFLSCSGPKKEVAGIKSEIQIDPRARDAASQFCDCMMDQNPRMEKLMVDMAENAKSCIQSVLQDHLEYFNSLSEEDQRKFTRSYLHAFVESKCFEDAFESIPSFVFDEFLK